MVCILGRNIFLLLFLWLTAQCLMGQTQAELDWWAQNVKWDGHTHWSRYIIRQPGFLGPNALPVPEVHTAVLNSSVHAETAAEYHNGTGEMACNPYLNLNIPLAKQKVALDLIYRPFEYYETDESIGLERRVRYRDCKGIAKGDLYIGTLIKLFSQEKAPFDAVMEIYFKTTTGKDLANARHIDAPGYYFDINAGRTLFTKDESFFKSIRLSGMAGLYVWQADLDNNRQNDAVLYGLRADAAFRPFNLSLSWAGYSGYLKLRDKPQVFRCTLERKFNNLGCYIRYQRGLRDVVSTGIRAGLFYNFN